MDASGTTWLVTVLAVAIVSAGIGSLATMLVQRRAARRLRAPQPAHAAGADSALVAVLAAAAHAALGVPVRVHRVHVHRGRGDEEWSRAGRMDIMVSHRVVPKR